MMKKYIQTLSPILFVLLLFSACAGGAAEEKAAVSHLLAPADFQKMLSETQNEILIDLRSHGELHQIGPISGARALDWNGGVFQKIYGNFPKEGNTFMLYCQSGGRSAKAVEMMKNEGFTNVYELEGGIQAWKQAGLPVQRHSH